MEGCRRFNWRASASRALDVELTLSRVLTLSIDNPVTLFSRRSALISRSGQSDRLTNSNCASVMSPMRCPVLGLRFETGDPGRTRSKGSTSSFDGVPVDSLKRSREAATLRPMPALEDEGAISGPELGDELDDGDGERRVRGRADNGEVMESRGSELDIRVVGRVAARPRSEARRMGRLRV